MMSPNANGNPNRRSIFMLSIISYLFETRRGRVLKIVERSEMPIKAVIRYAATLPMTAPLRPKPIKTSPGTRNVRRSDWLTTIKLLRCIFSTPVKAAVVVLTSVWPKIMKETASISGAIVGRAKTFTARYGASKRQKNDKAKPNNVLKISPARKMLRISEVLFSKLSLAE